jgi:hypothetical protein
MALVLDLLMSFYSPCDVAEKSFVYPLFFYGGQLLKLEGVFKPLTADRPSDIRHAAIPLLFMAAKMVRLAARGFRGCALLSVYVHTKLLSPAPFGAPETPAAIVAHVAEAQEEELHLVTQANELSLAQKALITRLSVLSSDKRQAVCALVERVQAALADPATEERFRSLVLQQREIEQARALVSNLRVRLHRLSTASTAEIERMEQKRTQGSLNG